MKGPAACLYLEKTQAKKKKKEKKKKKNPETKEAIEWREQRHRESEYV